jgi:transcriptional regulator with XRE-family HTH domain
VVDDPVLSGPALRRLREFLRIPQSDVARRMRISGSTLCYYEAEKRRLSPETAARICEAIRELAAEQAAAHTERAVRFIKLDALNGATREADAAQ